MDPRDRNSERARQEMVQTQLRDRGIRNPRILQAFQDVPRECFIPESHRHQAYEDHPVQIGHAQTISQPYVVALMLEHLDPRQDDRALEIGLGSGYQAALLSRLCRHVYAIERLAELTDRALDVLLSLGVDNISVCTADGALGWPEEAPFDAIISAAASPSIPQPWVDQLAEGGRLIAPIGSAHRQTLTLLHRRHERLDRRELGGVRFVKLIGKGAWREIPPRQQTWE